MKCPNCNGTGKEYSFYDGAESVWKDAICPTCNGTGEVWQTNEEYMRSCTTEQLAKVLGNIAKNAYQCGQNGKTNKCVNRNHCTGYCDYGWCEWLKQPHQE